MEPEETWAEDRRHAIQVPPSPLGAGKSHESLRVIEYFLLPIVADSTLTLFEQEKSLHHSQKSFF